MSSIETVKDVNALKLQHRHSLHAQSLKISFLQSSTTAKKKLTLAPKAVKTEQTPNASLEISRVTSRKTSAADLGRVKLKTISNRQKKFMGERALTTLLEATEASPVK